MKKISLAFILASNLLFAETFLQAPSNITRISPALNDDNKILSYHDSISDAKLAVVNISTTKSVNVSSPLFNDPFFKDFFGFSFKIPQEKQKTTSLGSGVIVSTDGYIVTNNHVIDDADEIVVTFAKDNSKDDKEYKAKLIGTDPKTDLAVIKVTAKDLKPIKFADSSKLFAGDVVFAIGNPFGVGSSVTKGIVSALNKDNIGLNQYENFIQTDASINPGNSGGALVDSRGALVGINSAILSRSGGNNGIGFAIPSNMVQDIAKKLIENGKIERGYIGVSITNLNDKQKDIYENKEGALISGVEKDSPAQKAGLKRGDLIIAVDDKNISDATDLKNAIGSLAPDTKTEIKFERARKINSVQVKLVNYNSISNYDKDNAAIRGLGISNLTDQIKRKFKLGSDINGVLVTDVKPKSKADNFGFEVGDIIVQVGENIITNINSFNKSIKESKQDKILVWVNRQGIVQGLVINK